MAHWARPGVRCVCISDNWERGIKRARHWLRWILRKKSDMPVVNEVCLITGVQHKSDGSVYLALDGLPRGNVPWGTFNAKDFKPLVSQSDDLALFEHHLDSASTDLEPAE